MVDGLSLQQPLQKRHGPDGSDDTPRGLAARRLLPEGGQELGRRPAAWGKERPKVGV